MSLDTFSNLKATVIRFSGRDDLSDLVDDFITLAEEKMFNNEDRPLRLRAFETTTTLTTTGGDNFVALPATYMGARSISIVSGGVECELKMTSPNGLRRTNSSGFPTQASIEGSNIIFNTTPDGAYDINLTYYARPTALSTSNPTNSVLTNHPSIYLTGCLAQLYDYTSEPDDSEMYYGKMIRSIKGAMSADNKGRYPNAASSVRGSIA